MYSSLKTILLAVMLVLSVAAQSQETEKYYESGSLQFEYNYRNGQKHGITKEYYETGEQKAEYNYRAGKLIAQEDFRRDGNLEYKLKYKNGKKIELRKKYYSTGELFREHTLVNGKIEGMQIDYYRNGQKKAKRNYVNGQRHGSAKGYHFNGKLQGDWAFKNGEPVSAVLYYSNGKKWLIHDDFDNEGRLDGSSNEYDKDGNLMAIRYYKKNEMVKRSRISPWFRWWWTLW